MNQPVTEQSPSISGKAGTEQGVLNLEIRPDGVAVITIDCPGESQNILNEQAILRTEALLAQLRETPELRGVVFRSAKPGSFIAGADINMIAACPDADSARTLSRRGQQAFEQIARFPVPVVAAIDGVCLGGGTELALACHGRVASDDPRTALGLPEVMLGLLPGAGGTQRLPRLIGIAASLDLMLTGRQLKPHRALRMGLVDDVVPASILLAVAVERIDSLGRGAGSRRASRGVAALQQWLLEKNPLGRKILFQQARKQTRGKTLGNYPAPERIIQCVEEGLRHPIERGLELEARAFGELAATAESRQLIHIYFASTALKKDPGVEGDVQPMLVNRVGVLGAGLMGAGIGLVTTDRAGLPVRLKDTREDGLNRGMANIHQQLQSRRKRRSLSAFEALRAERRVTPTLDYAGFRQLDVVIEAVFEDLDLKQQMVRDVEAHCPARVIFASNTSSIPVAKIAEAAKRPERVVGMHYFSPVEKMPLLEVIATERTAPEIVATAVALGKRQGKTVIVVKDGAGFYVNRILAPYINESGHLLQEGVPIDLVDRTLKQFGFPVGPFNLLDEVGIDVATKVGPILEEAFGSRMHPPAMAGAMLEAGRLGKKNARGFYRYPAKRGNKQVDTGVYELLGVMPRPVEQLDGQRIIERCVLPMINEAARCLEEGVIRNCRDGDIGAVFGIGFPPFRGGPFRAADSLGLQAIVEKLSSLADQHGERFQPAESLIAMAREGRTFYPA